MEHLSIEKNLISSWDQANDKMIDIMSQKNSSLSIFQSGLNEWRETTEDFLRYRNVDETKPIS